MKYVRLNKLTQEEAMQIIESNNSLKEEYLKEKELYGTKEFDYGFYYGNYFNYYDEKNNTIDNRVVIQWLQKKGKKFYNCEIIVDSLEETIVIVDEIEKSKANIDLNNSNIKINYYIA